MGRSVAEASVGMAPAFAILASNDAAARVASKNSASAGVQLFQPLGTRYGIWDHLGWWPNYGYDML